MDIIEKISVILGEGRILDATKKIAKKIIKKLAAGPRKDWPGMK